MNSKTPLTDAEENKPAFSPSEWIKFTRALEIAANGLRYSLSVVSWRCSNLHHDKSDQHHIGDPCPVEARIESILAEFDALKTTALQPKEPHE